MLYEDAKIQVDYEKGKLVARIICEEIKKSIGDEATSGENSKIYKLAKRCENQYSQVTKWMEAEKTCNAPWPGAADYFIPITEWTIDAVHARVMNTLFSQEPFMTGKGEDSSSIQNEESATDFVDMVFRNIIHIYDNINFFYKQMIKLPFAVLKYCWIKEFDSQIVKEDAIYLVNPATGEERDLLPDDPQAQMEMVELMANGWQQQGTRPVWVQKDVELINAPQLKYIRFEDYVWCPNAKRGTRLYWEGDRCWFTINELMLKASQGYFIQEGVGKVKDSPKFKELTGSEKILTERSALIESFNWYGRLPFNNNNEIDFEDKEAIEQEVCCVVAYKEEELLQIIRWPYRRIPFPDRVYMRGEFEETENFIGRSLAEKMYMSQKEMNTFINTIMNNAMLSMQKIFIKQKTLQGDEFSRPELYPGAMWEEDKAGDIRVLSVGDVSQIGTQLETMLMSFAERISNISIYQTGTARDQGGQKTLGEVQATISEGNIGMDKFIQRCHNILRKICDWTIDYYVDNMPQGLERKLQDETGKSILPTQDNIGKYQEKGIDTVWQSEQIRGKFNWIWNGTSLTSSKQWKLAVANDMMERYLPQPMVQGNMLATWEILRKGLIVRGEDWTTILPKKEAIIAEMTRQAQEAQQMQQQQAQQQNMQSAVKKALVMKSLQNRGGLQNAGPIQS